MALKMGWPAAVGIVAASAAAAYIANQIGKALVNSDVELLGTQATPDGSLLTARFRYRTQSQRIPTTIEDVNRIIANESQRIKPVTNDKGEPVPTPDEVMILENLPASIVGNTSSLKRMSSTRSPPQKNGNVTIKSISAIKKRGHEVNGNGFAYQNEINAY